LELNGARKWNIDEIKRNVRSDGGPAASFDGRGRLARHSVDLVYYSSQIVLLGAAFTRCYAGRYRGPEAATAAPLDRPA